MPADIEPCMWGSATLVTLVSSTCMTVTIITESVMAHRRAGEIVCGSAMCDQSLGIRSVLLIMNEPETAQRSASGCSGPGPSRMAPSGSASPMRPSQAAMATIATRTRLVGIGVPSKYFTLAPPPDSVSAVTLKRARRSEEHTSELQSLAYLVCRLLLEKKKTDSQRQHSHRA